MADKRSLNFIETDGGPFILLPMELKKSWNGTGDEEKGVKGDYEKIERFGTSVGVLDVKGGQVLILGSPEVTAFWVIDEGGLFIQRVFGDVDDDVIAAVEQALGEKDWKKTNVTFDVGKGKLALFDSAYSYDESDEEERLKIALPAGKYSIETRGVKTEAIDVELVRLRKSG